METRVREHQRDIRKPSCNQSVVSKHILEHDHKFKFSDPIILHKEKHIKKREIAEMFYIKKFNNTVNLQKDTDNLNVIYDKLIRTT